MDASALHKPSTTASPALTLAHEILVLDAALLKPLDCQQQEPITRRFVAELLLNLGMEPLGPLAIYPATDERAPGWSFIQPITTSHVSAHYFEKPGPTPHIRIDAYSCATIDWRQLIQVCDRHFALENWRASFIDRQIDIGSSRAVLDLSGSGARVERVRPLIDAALAQQTTPHESYHAIQ